jgi:hypothetical protein
MRKQDMYGRECMGLSCYLGLIGWRYVTLGKGGKEDASNRMIARDRA